MLLEEESLPPKVDQSTGVQLATCSHHGRPESKPTVNKLRVPLDVDENMGDTSSSEIQQLAKIVTDTWQLHLLQKVQ